MKKKFVQVMLLAALAAAGLPAFAKEALPAFDQRQLLISEICAVHAPKSDEADWVELFNPGAGELDLTGWTLSDREDKEGLVLSGAVPGEGYILISLKDADFGISQKGETLYLRDASGALTDSLKIGATSEGVTAGRTLGDETCVYFTEPTPGAENGAPMTAQLAKPTASDSALYRTEAFSLVLSAGDAGAEIRYTLDGTAPGADSLLYTEPILIEKTTCVRAVACADDALTSPELTLNYLFTEPHTVPVICFSGPKGELDDIFEDSHNHTRPEYKTAAVFYEANGSYGVGFPADLRIKGNASSGTAYPQKSLSAHLRKAYGRGAVSYPFFGGTESVTLTGFTLRSGGQDSKNTRLKDAFASRIARQTKTLAARTRAVAVYRNGEYAGIYWLTETINEEWLATNYNLKEEDIELVDRVHGVQAGTGERYKTAKAFINGNSLANEENYKRMGELLDIEAQTDTILLKMFFCDVDLYNQRWWSGPDGKLHPIFFDSDLIFCQGDENKVTVSRMFKTGHGKYGGNFFNAALKKNAGWRAYFVERYAELIETVLSEENLLAVLEETVAELAPEMERHIAVYGKPKSVSAWEGYLDTLRKEIKKKEPVVTKQVRSYFDVSESEMEALRAKYR